MVTRATFSRNRRSSLKVWLPVRTVCSLLLSVGIFLVVVVPASISASDGASPVRTPRQLTSQGPRFLQQQYVVKNVTSNTPANSVLLQVSATPGVLGRTFYYNIEGSDQVHVNPSSGIVMSKVPGYQLMSGSVTNFSLTTVDRVSGEVIARAVLLVVANSPPQFSDSVYEANVQENAVQESLVTAVAAHDIDSDPVNYFMQMDTEGQLSSNYRMFTINQQTGVIRLTSRPFQFNADLYEFTVVARDSRNNSNTALVLLRIVDENDHRPVFPDCDQYQPTVLEGAPRGQDVVQVTATDADKDINAEIVFSLVSSLGDHLQAFNINNVTGRLSTSRTFDRDDPINERQFRVLVKATDRGTPALEGTCSFVVRVLDVNDNAPLFDEATYSESISKTSDVPRDVMRISATDEDNNRNAELVYSLHVENSVDEGYFNIDKHSGIISLAKKLDQVALDYEFRLRGVVQDRGQPPRSASTSVTITVKDSSTQPPVFVQLPDRVYYLNETYRDTTRPIARFKAVSRTPGSQDVYYELVIAGLPKSQYMFIIEEADDGGAVLKYGTSKSMDYEHVKQYNITVLAKTFDQTSAEATFNIVLLDENDELPYFYDVDRVVIQENAPPGTFVATVEALDNDGTAPNNKVSYRLSRTSARDGLFSIDKNTGRISTVVSFDREQRAFHTVSVVAEDGAPSAITLNGRPNQVTQRVIVEIGDENDNPPTFSESSIYSSAVDENTDVGTKVFDVVATDPDTASKLHYEITGGNTGVAFGVVAATGIVYVKNALDYEAVRSYTLTVTVSDGKSEASHPVTVDVNNVNDMPPEFNQPAYEASVAEGNFSRSLIQIRAIDPDPVGRAHVVYSLSGPGTDNERPEENIFTIDHQGHIFVQKILDRDEGTGGREEWKLFVLARDDGGEGHASSVPFTLRLTDINDNAPYLVQSEASRPVIQENHDFQDIEISVEADDFDDHKINGPPYTFRMDPAASFSIQSKFSVSTIVGKNRAVIRPKVIFDREQQKHYSIPVLVGDSVGALPHSLTGTSMFTVIIGDENDNDMKPGSSAIQVFNFEGKMPSTVIGRVYVEDADDWDLPDKTFSWRDDQHQFRQFALDRNTGDITMLHGTSNGTYQLHFSVFDKKFQSRVNADVTVVVKLLPRVAVLQSGSARFIGVSAEQFISPTSSGPSLYARFIDQLAELFSTERSNVDVFGVQNNEDGGVDVRYAAHGSPYYAREKMDGLLAASRKQVERALGVTLSQVPIDDCMMESTCDGHSCYSRLLIHDNQVYTVQTNTSSIIGVRTELVYECGQCEAPLPRQVCLNDGHWDVKQMRCVCPEGFDGPNCQGLFIHFDGDHSDSFAWFSSLSACNESSLGFEVSTRDDKALLLYNGPTGADALLDSTPSDFVSVDLLEGRVRVLLNYGSGRQLEASPNLVINDGQLHRVLISWRADLLLVQLDHCLSVGNSNNSVQALSQCEHETRPSSSSSARAGSLLNVAAYPVQLGGARQVARWLDRVARRLNWSSAPLSSGSFTGCLHNLTFGHRVYDLSSPADSLHVLERCELLDSALPVITASPGFVVALIICLLLLIVLLVFMLLFRRKTRSHVLKQPMDELRDTIIKYNDEGGGEVDDLSYDLNVLQVPTPIFAKKELSKQKVDTGVAASTLTIAHFVEARRVKCDSDQNILPPDDVRDYAFEGFNSVAGSLSTLNTSGTTDDPLDFDYLKHAGGSFSTLNQLYNSPDDVEESDSDIAASTAASTTRC